MITTKKLTKKYGSYTALNNLDLQIKPGEVYSLLGANGAGKSTTLNILLGFLKPDGGTAQVNDLDATTNTSKTRQQIGYIPENVSLYPYLTGLENLDYFCKLTGKNYDKNQLSEFLTNCGLQKEAHNRRTETYSKGMRQKVGIAIAYAKKATVYLLDEPASGLDPVSSNELSVLLKKLAQEGATVLMASHDIFRVRETCNRIGILRRGELVKEMNTSEVTANELEKIYLDYMQD